MVVSALQLAKRAFINVMRTIALAMTAMAAVAKDRPHQGSHHRADRDHFPSRRVQLARRRAMQPGRGAGDVN